jgi:NAD(P)H-dependent flavin oxidoreductase YrpB (nitropropane dioxygenase family)
MLTTRFTELVGCSVPIQQAGMASVGMPPLAAAVAEAGGLGMLGGARVSPPALGLMLDDVHQRTSGPVGVNFLIPFLDRACVELAAAKARVVEFFYGQPDAMLVELVHTGGALACWQIGSREEAVAAAGAGCDFIVAQGVEAGGHVRGQIGLLALLDEVLEAVDLPVLAAGGIGTGRAMAAALVAGAAGVRVGTRFVAATESEAHPAYVEALLTATAQDTILTEAFSVGWPNATHRVLRSCVQAAEAFEGDVVAEQLLGDQRMPVPRLTPRVPTRKTIGVIAAMSLAAGESVSAVKRIQPAGEIVRELAAEAEGLLRR